MKKVFILVLAFFSLQHLSAQDADDQVNDPNPNSFESNERTANSFENDGKVPPAQQSTTPTPNSFESASANANRKASAPFDGGLTLVLAVGAAYGIKQSRSKRLVANKN